MIAVDLVSLVSDESRRSTREMGFHKSSVNGREPNMNVSVILGACKHCPSLAILSFAATASCFAQSNVQSTHEILDYISAYALAICAIPINNNSTTASLDASVRTELSRLSKLVATVSGEASGRLEHETNSGPLPSDVGKLISNSLECRQNIAAKLYPILLGNRLTSSTPREVGRPLRPSVASRDSTQRPKSPRHDWVADPALIVRGARYLNTYFLKGGGKTCPYYDSDRILHALTEAALFEREFRFADFVEVRDSTPRISTIRYTIPIDDVDVRAGDPKGRITFHTEFEERQPQNLNDMYEGTAKFICKPEKPKCIYFATTRAAGVKTGNLNDVDYPICWSKRQDVVTAFRHFSGRP